MTLSKNESDAVPEQPKTVTDAFHAHLDRCEQCRNHPFGLCPEGRKLLMQCWPNAGAIISQ